MIPSPIVLTCTPYETDENRSARAAAGSAASARASDAGGEASHRGSSSTTPGPLPGRQRVALGGPARVDLGQRHERERALAQASVRHDQVRLVDPLVAVGQDVEVEHARPPAIGRDPARLGLDAA